MRRIMRLPTGWQVHYWHAPRRELWQPYFSDREYGSSEAARAAALEMLALLDAEFGGSVYRQGYRRQSVRNRSGIVGIHVTHERGRSPRIIAKVGSELPQRTLNRSTGRRDPRQAFLECLAFRDAHTGEERTPEEREQAWLEFRAYALHRGIEL